MKHYSDDQLDILKKLANADSVVVDTHNRNNCRFLRDEGLVFLKQFNGVLLVSLTPKGDSYLKTLEVDYSRRNEDVDDKNKTRRIAIIALIISALSMLISLISVIISALL